MLCIASHDPPQFPTRIRRQPIKILQQQLVMKHLQTARGPRSLAEGGRGRTKRGEEPSILSRGVSLLKSLLDGLLRVLPLRHLLEGVGRHRALQALQLQRVPRGHQVVVVDDLDERLDLAALLLARLGHAACDLQRVALDAGDQGVRVWVRLVADVLRLDDHDL
jgi:hypothetical protein